MGKALEKFLSLVKNPSVNELFFRYRNVEYQISFCGRYVIVEDTVSGDAEEFCFAGSGDALVQTLLDAAPRGIAIRTLLSELPEEELIATR